MEIKRNKDGTIKGVYSMGDDIKKENKTQKELEREKKKKEYEKKWGNYEPLAIIQS